MPGGTAPHFLPVGDSLWVVVSAVPARDYDEAALAERIADIDWLARCGEAHHAVIDRAARSHAVAPFRLLTLFRSESRAAEEMGRIRSRIGRALDRVEGCQEWVLRVALAPRSERPRAARARSGTAYLLARAAESRSVATDSATARRVSKAFFAEVKPQARAIVRRATAETPHILYDAALLVEKPDARALAATVRQWRPRLVAAGCDVWLTGPWPPYSFVSLQGSANSRRGAHG